MSILKSAHRFVWGRANTFREKFLTSQEDAVAMGLSYDERGSALVDEAAVIEAVRMVEAERVARAPNWRLQNLGPSGRKRPPNGSE